MATINVAGNQITYSLGGIIALIVLVVCIVLAIIGQSLSTLLILGMIGAIALSRLC